MARSQTITILHESTRTLLEPIIPRQSFTLVRERIFKEADLFHVIMQLRNEHATGTLTVHLGQGGVCHVAFSDRQPVPHDASE